MRSNRTSGSTSNTSSNSGGNKYSSSKGNRTPAPSIKSLSRKVWIARIVFLLCLCSVAVVLGYTADWLLTGSETKLAVEQFDSIASRALGGALENTYRKRYGVIEIASIAAYGHPDAESWPFVYINGFETIALNVLSTSTGIDSSVGLCTFVLPEQVSEFEDFAYNTVFKKKFPEGAVVHSFGEGIYGIDFSLNNSDYRFHDTDGNTTWGSPYKVLAPFLYHSDGDASILMGNYRTLPDRGKDIDEMITCSLERAQSENASLIECSTLTDIVSFGAEVNPSAVIHQPIYPANNDTVLVGLVTSTIRWGDVLEHIFSDEVSGVDCVLKTETQAYTYLVRHGNATLLGEGELHSTEFSHYGQTIALTTRGMFSNTSSTYSLTLYPNDDFFRVYSTNNPTIATLGSVLIIIFTSLLFLMYDFFVRKEFSNQRAVMEAKRRFMRFVSHEVRTPLNSICMGLEVLNDEISRFGGLKNKNRSKEAMTYGEGQVRKTMIQWSELAGDILANAHSAVTVLSDLLNYDKIEQGTLQLELTVVPIWDLVERTATEFKYPASIKNINYQVDFGPLLDQEAIADKEAVKGVAAAKLPHDVLEQKVVGDVIRITQVLRNFLSNAIKFTPEGGDIVVRASWTKDAIDTSIDTSKSFVLHRGDEVTFSQSGYVKVSVIDSGAGMSDEQLAKVFGEGIQFNVNELQVGQGSGLGLFIAKGIVELHEGTLAVASKGLGRGTTFTLLLPLFHAPDTALPENLKRMQRLRVESSLDERKESDSVHPSPVLRILVVDDTTMNRKLLVRLLQNKGHFCDEAENGQRAVDRVKAAIEKGDPYATILMDYEMPVMNGPTAAKEIRELGCDSFIVGITGNILPEDVAYFKSCGANTVLPKPLDLGELEELWMEHGVAISMV